MDLEQARGSRAAVYVWRRLHEGNIIAEAAPVPGMGSWRVSAYIVTVPPSEVVYALRAVSLLTEAHESADNLVREQFAHVCRTGSCGQWLRWRQDDPDVG